MSSDYYGGIAGELADTARDYYACCDHCADDCEEFHSSPCEQCQATS